MARKKAIVVWEKTVCQDAHAYVQRVGDIYVATVEFFRELYMQEYFDNPDEAKHFCVVTLREIAKSEVSAAPDLSWCWKKFLEEGVTK